MHALRASNAFDGEGFLTDGATVLIQDDRILGVEAFGFQVPADCPVASYQGTLLPGLIDTPLRSVCLGRPKVGSVPITMPTSSWSDRTHERRRRRSVTYEPSS